MEIDFKNPIFWKIEACDTLYSKVVVLIAGKLLLLCTGSGSERKNLSMKEQARTTYFNKEIVSFNAVVQLMYRMQWWMVFLSSCGISY